MKRTVTIILLGTVAGCGGPAYLNRELAHYEPRAGYRFETLQPGRGNTDSTFVCLTFSGGGTRAAALAYGVLEELRDTPLAAAELGMRRSLLDEVDVISGVSGGSFTAIACGLWRETLFDGRFERRFLYRNVQRDLLLRVFAPLNLVLLPFIALDRIDIAADYFHDELFDRRSYADLVRTGRRPLVVVNATNVASGRTFEFTQNDFDILGSDLGSVPLGYAVAASSAVPVLFSPMRMRYYAGPASSAAIEHTLAAASRPADPRLQEWARSLVAGGGEDPAAPLAIDAKAHRYLYLMDGGVTDNLGLTWVIESYRHGEIRRLIEAPEEHRIRDFVVIVVNAGVKRPEYIESLDSAPGMVHTGFKTTMISLDINSTATMQILRSTVEDEAATRAAYRACAETIQRECPQSSMAGLSQTPDIRVHIIEVAFRNHPDPRERRRLLSLPTTFRLPPGDVDALVRAGRILLRQHPDFQQLLHDLRP